MDAIAHFVSAQKLHACKHASHGMAHEANLAQLELQLRHALLHLSLLCTLALQLCKQASV